MPVCPKCNSQYRGAEKHHCFIQISRITEKGRFSSERYERIYVRGQTDFNGLFETRLNFTYPPEAYARRTEGKQELFFDINQAPRFELNQIPIFRNHLFATDCTVIECGTVPFQAGDPDGPATRTASLMQSRRFRDLIKVFDCHYISLQHETPDLATVAETKMQAAKHEIEKTNFVDLDRKPWGSPNEWFWSYTNVRGQYYQEISVVLMKIPAWITHDKDLQIMKNNLLNHIASKAEPS